MHHTTDLTNSDRADLARSAVGAFLTTVLRSEFAPYDPIGVVSGWENAVRTGDDKTAQPGNRRAAPGRSARFSSIRDHFPGPEALRRRSP
jgi:hypothetical protein